MRLLAAAGAALLLLTAPPLPAAAVTPTLLVVVVVDQLRSDYLTTLAHRWRDGFRTLTTQGAVFSRAEYPYLNTVTCAGHTTIGTGAYPRTHGMVLNGWFHRDEGRAWNCMDDEDAPHVSYAGPAKGGNSPKRMLVPTLGDALLAAHPDSRVVSLSLKPRSAIGLAGRGGIVTWFDVGAHGFVTSTQYADAPVPAVRDFIAERPIEKDLGAVWTLRWPPASYREADDRPGERPPAGWGRTFPHPLEGKAGADHQFVELWEESPYSDEYLAGMATSLVDTLALGRRDVPDFLGISFSALDLVGHDFGPFSVEVEDLLGRLDTTLGTLIGDLDRAVGRERYMLALSADHGVSPIPEDERHRNARGGRVVIEDVRERIEGALVKAWGPPPAGPGGAGRYVAAMSYVYVYFAPGVFERLARDRAAFRAMEKAVRGIPGVHRVLRADRLSSTSRDPLERAAALNHRPERSGDVIVVPQPYWFMAPRNDASAATHGTNHPYDRHVPVLLFGAGVKPGTYTQRATPADIAPTLAAAIGLALPNAEGRVLKEALRR